MLDRFATEILLHILSFLPTPDVVAAPPLRTTTLYNLCLVSKRLRIVSQPLLWRIVAVKSPSQVAAVSNESAELREHTRGLSIEVGRGEGELAMAMVLVASFRGLKDLRLTSSFRFSRSGEAVWAYFSALAALRRLVLSSLDFTFDLARPPPILSSLTSLTLCSCRLRREQLQDILHPSILPSLRALALSFLRSPAIIPFTPSLNDFPSLLPQLDFVQFQSHFEDFIRTYAAPSILPPLPVLITADASIFHYDNLPLFPALQHLQIVSKTLSDLPPGLVVDARSAAALRNLETLATSLSTQPTTLKTLVLPRYFITLRTVGYFGEYAPVDELIEVCAQRGIEVLWNEGGEEFGLSEVFWRWVRQRKEREREVDERR